MSVSVRSSMQLPANNNKLNTLQSSRQSATGGQVLRHTAATNILSQTRHSNTEAKFNPRTGRTQSSAAEQNKNTSIISLDELQRIRQQCATGAFSNTFARGNSTGFD
jgi:hypothetical protein